MVMINNNDFIFGIRPVIEAINSGKTIDKLLIKKGLSGELIAELNSLVKANNILAQLVPEEKLQRITRKTHQGVIAFLSPVPFYQFDEVVTSIFEKGETPLLLFLDQVSDVRNFGAIVRTAECAGVHAIIVPEKGSAQINADAVKTSAGALLHLPVCKVRNSVGAIRTLKNSGLTVYAATEKAATSYFDHDFSVPTVIIMGAEDNGISDELIRQADHLVRIPLTGKINSLNVSVAAGILLFESVKQRMISKA
jgi:23S rRNA (guanosine2251-2'-O)-methyltransferase